MITEPGGMTLTDAKAVIDHDYVNNVPSTALIYAARRVLAELEYLHQDCIRCSDFYRCPTRRALDGEPP